MEYLKSKHLCDSGSEHPPSQFCCYLHMMAGHIVLPSDFYYRCFYLYDSHTGTATGMPTYEIFMLCQKLLFVSLESVGLRALVEAALDHDAAAVEKFYEFTNYRLNLKVLSALEEVVSAKLSKLEKHRVEDDSYSPSRRDVAMAHYGPEFSRNEDLKLWTSFKAVSNALLEMYRHHYLMDFDNFHKDLNFISQLTAYASDLCIPKTADGKHAMPELDTATMIIQHKQQRDDTVHRQCLCEKNNAKLHANSSYMEDYNFTRFFMDASVIESSCPQRMAMAARIKKFVNQHAALKLSTTRREGNLTKLATGCAGNELSDHDNDSCLWLYLFAKHYESGRMQPQQQLMRLNRMTKVLGMSVIDLVAPHSSPASTSEVKNMISQLAQYEHSIASENVYEVHRVLDSLGYIVHNSKRTDPAHLKVDMLRVLTGILKESAAHGDWFTFGLAVVPFSLHHSTSAGTITTAPINNGDRNAVLDLLADCVMTSDNHFAICQACSALALFFQNDANVKKVCRRGLLDGVMNVLKQRNLSDNVVAQLCLLLPPLFKPAFIGVLDEVTAKRYMIILHVTLTAILSNTRKFGTMRFQIRPHELAINSFVNPDEPSIVPIHKMHFCRQAEQTRSRAVISVYSILQYTFNISLHTNSTFFQMGAVRLMHLGMKEKDKGIILAALRACAVLLRDATVPYQHSAVKLPGFIGDVARIFCKYKTEATEEASLDIMASLCAPCTGIVDRDAWCKWIDSPHCFDRLIPKIVHHALLIPKPLTIPTYSMAALVLISQHSNKDTFAMLKSLDILKICQRNMSNTARLHGHCQTQKLATHCIRTMLGMLSRGPELLEEQEVQDLFPLLMTYIGRPYPPVKAPFKRLNPIWRGSNCTSFRDCPGAPLTDEDLDKMERRELFSSSLSVIDFICTMETTPVNYYATRFVDAGFVECFERVLLKASVNFGNQLLKRTHVLDNVDTYNQYGWNDVIRVCKTLQNIAGREAGEVLVNRFFATPGPMNALHNAALLAQEQGIAWEQLAVIVDAIQVIVSVCFVPHFDKSPRTGSSKSALVQAMESRQNMFRNKWKGQMLLDTIFDLYTATVDKPENESVCRFLVCLKAFVGEDYIFASILETTETYRRYSNTGKCLPIVPMDMMECQLAFARKKPGSKRWQPVNELLPESFKKFPVRSTWQQDILTNSDALISQDISQEERYAAAATDRETVRQEIRQKVLGRLTPQRTMELQQICLEENHTTIFELDEVKVVFDEEMSKHVKPPTIYETMLANLRHYDLPIGTKAPRADSGSGSTQAESTSSSSSPPPPAMAQAKALIASVMENASSSRGPTMTQIRVVPAAQSGPPRPTPPPAVLRAKKLLAAEVEAALLATLAGVSTGASTAASTGASADTSASASSTSSTSSKGRADATEDALPAGTTPKHKSAKSYVCDFCGEGMDKARKCARCRKAYYCSRECQRSAWQDHRPVCG